MNRRSFLQALGLTVAAAAIPVLASAPEAIAESSPIPASAISSGKEFRFRPISCTLQHNHDWFDSGNGMRTYVKSGPSLATIECELTSDESNRLFEIFQQRNEQDFIAELSDGEIRFRGCPHHIRWQGNLTEPATIYSFEIYLSEAV